MQLLLAGVLFVFAARCAPVKGVSLKHLFIYSLLDCALFSGGARVGQAGFVSTLFGIVHFQKIVSPKRKFATARQTAQHSLCIWLLSAVNSDGIV
jgi:cytochrome b561